MNITDEQTKEIFILGMEYQVFIETKEQELKKELEKNLGLEKALENVMKIYPKNKYDVYVIELNCFYLYAKAYIYYNDFEKGFLIDKVEYYTIDDELITTLDFNE